MKDHRHTKYVLKRVCKRRDTSSTKVARGSVSAFIKYDSHDEYPYTVYNEIVAYQLCRFAGIPVADSVLVDTDKETLFASLELCNNGKTLPDLRKNQINTCAKLYSDLVVLLIVFDIWIGNFDRSQNIKASLDPNQPPFFRVFDHSHCLLNAAGTQSQSLSQLYNGYLIVRYHPFYHHHKSLMSLYESAGQIANIRHSDIEAACIQPLLFDSVDESTQRKLATALTERSKFLPLIIERHLKTIATGGKSETQLMLNKLRRQIRKMDKRKLNI